MPFLLKAFALAMNEIVGQLPTNDQLRYESELIESIRQMCHPDPHLRGHPGARKAVGKRVGIDRYISLFNRLARLTAVQLRRS